MRNVESANRREFLQRVTSAAAGLACFGDPGVLRAALTAALREGKPPLTEGTINQLIAELRAGGRRASQEAATQATADLKRFLNGRFVVVPQQEAVLDSIGPESRAEFNRAVEQGMSPPNRLFVRIARQPRGEPAPRPKGPNPGSAWYQGIVLTVNQTPNELGGVDFDTVWACGEATRLFGSDPGLGEREVPEVR
jgi:hypothetical protein